MRILVANGVNLDLLGTRETHIYGHESLAEIENSLRSDIKTFKGIFFKEDVELDFFQTNREYEFLEKIALAFDGILINPGAWTHTSLALADRLKGLKVPYVEIHLSNLAAREEIRQTSLTAEAAKGVVYGFGPASYRVGLFGLLLKLQQSKLG